MPQLPMPHWVMPETAGLTDQQIRQIALTALAKAREEMDTDKFCDVPSLSSNPLILRWMGFNEKQDCEPFEVNMEIRSADNVDTYLSPHTIGYRSSYARNQAILLGHYLLHYLPVSKKLLNAQTGMYIPSNSKLLDTDCVRQACIFSLEFLLPEDLLRAYVKRWDGELRNVYQFLEWFGTRSEIESRLKHFGILDECGITLDA